MHSRVRRILPWTLGAVLVGSGLALGQFDEGGPGGPGAGAAKKPIKNADDPIKMVYPTVDKKGGTVTLPAAFWNEKMTSWVEVAVCGRPSDFLHETIVCITSTRSIMLQAMHAAGFHDADAWGSYQDFPRIRGDRFIILLTFTPKGASKPETYALDEMLSYQGWGVSAGPYGWMFKGDPEHEDKAAASTEPPTAADDKQPDVEARTKIVRDDPQIALVLKGIQHTSISFADHPMVYDDWIYPMMRYSRNYRLLPAEVYDSNGDVPVTMTIQKVNEEQFITEMAKVWHDRPCAENMLKELPTARQIDKDKAALWALLPELKKMRATPAETRDALAEEDLYGKIYVLAANIEKGYAEMDGSTARWAADHAVFDSGNDKDLKDLQQQAAIWREHMDLRQKRAEQLAVAEQASFDIKRLVRKQSQTDADKLQLQKLRGTELEGRSSAMLDENVHPRAYWKFEQGRLDPKTDPRTDWIREIGVEVELTEARDAAGNAGLVYARALEQGSPEQIASSQKIYLQAVVRMKTADLERQLADVDFEISKREGIEDADHPDPDLPKFRAEKKAIEGELKEARAATQPAASTAP